MRRLGLTFGALDFVMTADGDLVFLEVNPNGQWLWLDDQLDFGISEAVAAWLALPSVRSPQIA
jgi:D-alanine-D-alanine ligase-like ATP-grasp enzyme